MAERTEGRSRLQGKGGGDFPVSWHGNEKSRGANGTYVGRWRNIEPAKEFEGLEIVFQGWYDIRTEGGGERGEGHNVRIDVCHGEGCQGNTEESAENCHSD